MKAIILAAGEGKRMRPLTLVKPKPMVEVLGKPLLHHIIDALPSEITELIIVIGYKGEQIVAYFGDVFEGRPVTYIRQEKPEGQAHALLLCREFIAPHERFLFLFADDLHSARALKALLRHERAILVREHEHPERFGVVTVSEDGRVRAIEEKPEHPKSNLVVTGVYLLDSNIFGFPLAEKTHGEYYIADQINKLVKGYDVVVEKTDFWHPVGYPEDIASAEKVLKGRQKTG